MKKLLAIIIGLIFCLGCSAFASDQVIVLHVIEGDIEYIDLDLRNKLGFMLSGLNGLDIVWADEVDSWKGEREHNAGEVFSHEYQLDLANHFHADYLVWIRIIKANSNISSSTVLPFVFKSHKRKYFLEVELRIIDTRSGRIVKQERIEESTSGSRSLAYLDLDETNEPGLHSSYTQQMMAFRELEDKAAKKIMDAVVETAREKRP